MSELKAYAGLIRNHAELASDLAVNIAGCTRAEREELLVVAAYDRWGVNMGAHINGQFAVAIYDEKTRELFCTRDPLGAELLFYTKRPRASCSWEPRLKTYSTSPASIASSTPR